MLEIVSNSPVAVQTILDLASKIEEGQVRLGEVISDYEDYVGDEDNPEDVEKVLTKIAQLAKLNSQAVTVRAKSNQVRVLLKLGQTGKSSSNNRL